MLSVRRFGRNSLYSSGQGLSFVFSQIIKFSTGSHLSRGVHNSALSRDTDTQLKMNREIGRDVLSVAPMMDWTDRHYRYLMRLLTKRTKLYTEMVVENTLKHSPVAEGYLRFHPAEHPIAVQLGGSCPEGLAAAARMAEEAGFDEINLNCGCPSPRVAGKGCFGAALMFSPELVRDCVRAMREAAPNTEITVKCRLGADHMDSYEEFRNFVAIVAESGCKHFIVHARKAYLKGLDPKANRTVPPLRYYWVQRIALEFPHLRFSLNGGIISIDQIEQLLSLTRDGEPLEFPSAPELTEEERQFVEQRRKQRREKRKKAASAEASALTAESPESPESSVSAESAESKIETQTGTKDEPEILHKACCVEEGDSQSVRSEPGSPEGDDGDQSGGENGDEKGNGDGSVSKTEDPDAEKYRQIMTKKAKHDAIVGRVPPEQFFEGVRQGEILPGSYGDYTTHIFDSLMIGRAAYNNMWIFADVDRRIFGESNPGYSRREIVEKYLDYCETVADTVPEHERQMSLYKPFEMAKPLIGLFAGERGSGKFRAVLTQGLLEKRLGIREAVTAAIEELAEGVLDERPPTGDSQE